MHIDVDMMLCEGHGVCVLAAPDVFELDDDDQLTVLDESPPEGRRAAVESAAMGCPKRAIRVLP